MKRTIAQFCRRIGRMQAISNGMPPLCDTGKWDTAKKNVANRQAHSLLRPPTALSSYPASMQGLFADPKLGHRWHGLYVAKAVRRTTNRGTKMTTTTLNRPGHQAHLHLHLPHGPRSLRRVQAPQRSIQDGRRIRGHEAGRSHGLSTKAGIILHRMKHLDISGVTLVNWQQIIDQLPPAIRLHYDEHRKYRAERCIRLLNALAKR